MEVRKMKITKKILADIIAYEGEVFGNTKKECGNYLDLDLELKSKPQVNLHLLSADQPTLHFHGKYKC